MSADNKNTAPSFFSAVLPPVAGAATGALAGSALGGLTARGLSRSGPVSRRLKQMNPAERAKLLKRIRLITGTVMSTSGAAAGALTSKYVQDRLDTLKKRRESSNEKTASVYDAYISCFEAMI